MTKTATLHARRYVRPDGTVVVRLVTEPLIEAEDRTLAAVGLDVVDSDVSADTVVGEAPMRAVGFPAWPILSDPDNARHALNLVGDVEWARGAVVSRPKEVAKRFEGLTADLTASAPHFVPTLLEEVTRLFALTGEDVLARRTFSQAREVERAHRIEVDPERHRRMFAEFAALGAVNARELSTEIKASVDRFAEPAEAVEYVLSLVTDLVAVGTAPTMAMVKDVRKVAKAAGLPAGRSDALVFDAVLGGRGFLRAPESFFTTLGQVTTTFLTENPDRAEYFAGRFPTDLGVEGFLRILDGCGWLDRQRQDGPAHAMWLLSLIADNTYVLNVSSELLNAEIVAVGADLRPLAGTRSIGEVHPSILDTLCRVGGVTAEGGEVRRAALDYWLRDPVGELDALAEHPTLGLKIMISLASFRIDRLTDHLDELLAHSGTRVMLRRWLGHLVERRAGMAGALPELGTLVQSDLPLLADERLEELAPGEMAALFSFSASEEFAAAVRSGLTVEYTWPALEKADTRLREDTGEPPQLFSTFPQLALVAGDRIEILDGNRTPRVLTGPIAGQGVRGVYDVDGKVLVLFVDGSFSSHQWWEGDAAATPMPGGSIAGSSGSLAVPGGRLIRDQILALHGNLVGDSWTAVIAFADGRTHTVSDFGRTYRRWNRPTPETDTPVAGASVSDAGQSMIVAETGLGALLTDAASAGGWDWNDDWSKKGWGAIQWESTFVLPVPDTASEDNPLGAIDGTLFSVTVKPADDPAFHARRTRTPRGEFDGNCAVIVGPGTAPWKYETFGRWDETGNRLSSSRTSDGQRHVLDRLPPRLWCIPAVRDRDASAAMRGYTAGQAKEVLAVLVPDAAHQIPVSHSGVEISTSIPGAGVVSVLREQLGTGEDDTVPVALGHLAADCVALEERFSLLRDTVMSSGEPAVENYSLDDGPRSWVAPWPLRMSETRWEDATRILVSWTRSQEGEGEQFRHEFGDPLVSAASLIGRERVLLNHWASPLFPQEYIAPLTRFAQNMVEAGLWCGDWATARIRIPVDRRTEFDAEHLSWHDLGARVMSLHGQGYNASYHSGKVTVLVRREERQKITGDVLVEPPDESLSISREEFLEGLDALARTGAKSDESSFEARATELQESTSLSAGAARILSGAVHEVQYLDAEQRARYGSPTRALETGWEQVLGLGWDIVESLLVGTASLSPAVELTDREWQHVGSLSVGYYRSGARVLTPLIYQGEVTDPAGAMAVLLEVIFRSPLNDPRRPAFAGLLREICTSARIQVDSSSWQEYLGDMDLGTSVEDKTFKGRVTPEEQTVRVASEGLLDGLIADLDTVYEGLGGDPADPRNSVPELVRDVAAALGVGDDTACYYLQLLAMVDPSDVNVRTWNGWRKKDIDRASAELLSAGLVVEAKRTGAGRSRFLPGGWLPGRGGINSSRPTEVWTAPMHLMWQDTKSRPVIPGAPPHRPVHELFQLAWQRISDGDIPGYDKLTTTRYRSKR